jgi:hypothetical protein
MFFSLLGNLMEFLPNLKFHPLINTDGTNGNRSSYSNKLLDNDVDLGLTGEMSSTHSTNYFTLLVNYPTLNSRNGYQLAVTTMKEIHLAYIESTNVENSLFRISEIVKKLYSLSPASLVKQLERSLSLSKIKQYIDNPELVEDLNRSQERDTGRLTSYKTAEEYLQRLPTILSFISNLKHYTGFISSFLPALDQLKNYRIIQDHWLHLKLPSAYSLRASLLYDFLRKMENYFDLSEEGLGQEKGTKGKITQTSSSASNSSNTSRVMMINTLSFKIDLLRKLQHFDEMKESLDIEIDICDTIYSVLQLYSERKQIEEAAYSLEDLKLHNLLNSYLSNANQLGGGGRGRRGELSQSIPAISSEKMMKTLKDGYDRMIILISLGRSFLLSQLNDTKHELFSLKTIFHTKIQNRYDIISNYSIITKDHLILSDNGKTNKSIEEGMDRRTSTYQQQVEQKILDISSFIEENKVVVEALRTQVNEMIVGQQILLHSHDIVGAAHPVMVETDLDLFHDLETLEFLFINRMKAWNILRSCDTLTKSAAVCRLSSSQMVIILDLCKQFVSISSIYEEIKYNFQQQSDTTSKDYEIVTTIEKKLSELQPKIELVTCLSSKAIRPRHWMRLQHSVFHDCNIELRFTGRHSEFISVFDISNNKEAALGNISRLSAHDLFSRFVVLSLFIYSFSYLLLISLFLLISVMFSLINLISAFLLLFFTSTFRGVEKYISKIRNVSADSVVESMLETTLDTIDETLRLSTIQISNAWLRDPRLRSKLFVEINEIMNCIPLRIMIRYCWKSLMIIESTCQDMYVTTFDERLELNKELILKIDKFLENYREIQYLWNYLLSFLKFTLHGEFDRESHRIFNNVTDEMKKIELTLLNKNGNLFNAFTAASTLSEGDGVMKGIGGGGGGGEKGEKSSATAYHDLFTDNLKNNLNLIMDDCHNGIQSLLDACPRLSLLSYDKLVQFYRIWLSGPQLHIPFISECLNELFEGVGELKITMSLPTSSHHHHSKQQNHQQSNLDSSSGQGGEEIDKNAPNLVPSAIYLCTGFWSSSKLEYITFHECIDLSLSLDEFINDFRKSLRKTFEKSCDSLILHRLNCIKALLSDNTIETIIDNIETLFSIRNHSLLAVLSENYPNFLYLLINNISFAEDIWTCLGHPTGCLTTARPDLFLESLEFIEYWKESLKKFIQQCKENIRYLQQYYVEPSLLEPFVTSAAAGATIHHPSSSLPRHNLMKSRLSFPSHLNKRKGSSLISSFILQEVYYMNIAEELLSCSCLESATELWAGRYQLRYQYDKLQRYHHCPIEITVGNILIPYGFEYQEGGTVFLHTKEVEYAVSRVLSSAFSSHGSTFINTSDLSSLIKNNGQYSVTGKDIALALGRICTTLNHSTSNVVNVKFFLSRLIYLDAIGKLFSASYHLIVILLS